MSSAARSEPPGLAPLPFDGWSEAARAALLPYLRRPERYLSGGAPMPGAMGLLAHHAELGAAWLAFTQLLVRPGTATLDPRLRELAILRVAWGTGSDYEWVQHVRIGRDAGLALDRIQAVPAGPDAPGWAPEERLVLAAADQVVATARIDGPTWTALAEVLDPAQLLELSFVIGGYLCFAAVANSARLAADPPDAATPDAPRRST